MKTMKQFGGLVVRMAVMLSLGAQFVIFAGNARATAEPEETLLGRRAGIN